MSATKWQHPQCCWILHLHNIPCNHCMTLLEQCEKHLHFCQLAKVLSVFVEDPHQLWPFKNFLGNTYNVQGMSSAFWDWFAGRTMTRGEMDGASRTWQRRGIIYSTWVATELCQGIQLEKAHHIWLCKPHQALRMSKSARLEFVCARLQFPWSRCIPSAPP